MADTNTTNNKKFLSTADDYIKSVLTYETLDDSNARLQLNKMDDTDPITLIDTRYWNRNIVLKDFENTSYTISPLDNLDGDIEFQLPDTIRNDVSGVVINGEGNKLLYSDKNNSKEENILLDNSLKDQIYNPQIIPSDVNNMGLSISESQYNVLKDESIDDLLLEVTLNSTPSFMPIASISTYSGDYWIIPVQNALVIDIGTYTIYKKIIITPIKETELIYDAEKSAISYGRAENTEIGQGSIAWGNNSTASGNYSLAYGGSVLGGGPTATGNNSIALGVNAVAEELSSIAIGPYAFSGASHAGAFGSAARAEGEYSFAIGQGVIADQADQIVIGKFNSSNEKAFFIIGDGPNEAFFLPSKRHNALTLEEGGVQTLYGNSTGNTYLWISGTLPQGLNAKENIDVSNVNAIRQKITAGGASLKVVSNNYPIEEVNFGLGLGQKYLGLWFGRNDGQTLDPSDSPIVPEFKNGNTNITPYIAPSGWIMNFNPCGGDWVQNNKDSGGNPLPDHPRGEVTFDRNVKFNQKIRVCNYLSLNSSATAGFQYNADSDRIDTFGIFNFTNEMHISTTKNNHTNSYRFSVGELSDESLTISSRNSDESDWTECLSLKTSGLARNVSLQGSFETRDFGIFGDGIRLKERRSTHKNLIKQSGVGTLVYYKNGTDDPQLFLVVEVAADGGGTKKVLKNIQLGDITVNLEDE